MADPWPVMVLPEIVELRMVRLPLVAVPEGDGVGPGVVVGVEDGLAQRAGTGVGGVRHREVGRHDAAFEALDHQAGALRAGGAGGGRSGAAAKPPAQKGVQERTPYGG